VETFRANIGDRPDSAALSRLAEVNGQSAMLEASHLSLKARIEELEAEIAREKAAHVDAVRAMHNTILELKGNVRVMCRMRPAMGAEEAAACPLVLNAPNAEVLISAAHEKGEATHSFQLDGVFDSVSSQSSVFDEVKALVQSAIDGYKVCIFAYGQTGSGKTHTMVGTESDRGIIPRSLEAIIDKCSELERAHGWKYAIDASFLEVYNETLRDLLSESGRDGPKLEIHHDCDGRTVVSDLTTKRVSRRPFITSESHAVAQCHTACLPPRLAVVCVLDS
jgi:kinesin family protein C1